MTEADEVARVRALATALDHRGVSETYVDAAVKAVELEPTRQQLLGLMTRLGVAHGRLKTAAAQEDREVAYTLVLGLASLVRGRDRCLLILRDGGLNEAQLGELADMRSGQVRAALSRAEAARRAR